MIELSFAEKKEAKEYDNDLLEQAITMSLAQYSDKECDPTWNKKIHSYYIVFFFVYF